MISGFNSLFSFSLHFFLSFHHYPDPSLPYRFTTVHMLLFCLFCWPFHRSSLPFVIVILSLIPLPFTRSSHTLFLRTYCSIVLPYLFFLNSFSYTLLTSYTLFLILLYLTSFSYSIFIILFFMYSYTSYFYYTLIIILFSSVTNLLPSHLSTFFVTLKRKRRRM